MGISSSSPSFASSSGVAFACVPGQLEREAWVKARVAYLAVEERCYPDLVVVDGLADGLERET